MVVFGQDGTQAYLQQMLQQERVPHALLLAGKTGWGTLALALELTRWLQCQYFPQTSSSCSCPACQKATRFLHPDIHFSFPVVGTNALSADYLKEWREALSSNPWLSANEWFQRIGAENKQGNITKEECVAIVRQLSLKAFEGRYKILLMWLPEYLGKEGNRLLKLIEEPPERTVFVLVSENTDAILPTILSRCQLLKTQPLSDEAIAEALRIYQGVEAERAQQIAFLADGDYNRALHMVEAFESDSGRMLVEWLRSCWRGNGVELVRWAERFAQLGRENQKEFLAYVLQFLRELLVLKVSPQVPVRLRPAELETARKMTAVFSFEHITQLVSRINEFIVYIERNANPKILMLSASINIHHLIKKPQNV
ncbi:MAG: hypothetical protein NZM43_09335 [Saprospiraceae bacterium]|nr:hypothetical protein [Saprospiraceae bacterium]MDW8484517.1 hypothetical protein [Saprospiraceae bacterium]